MLMLIMIFQYETRKKFPEGNKIYGYEFEESPKINISILERPFYYSMQISVAYLKFLVGDREG